MNNEIRLLDASLLTDSRKLREISYWLRVMNRPNGWHYDLDKIWILDQLEQAGIGAGATIVDAGAGQGDMQYLLASRGYNVISLDFSPRTRPARSVGVFNVVGKGDMEIAYQHPYMKFISYGANSSVRISNVLLKLANLKKLPQRVRRVWRDGRSWLFYLFERFARSHDRYGTVTYVRAPFHDVPLASGSVDAVISISAIEHADTDLFEQNIKELMRLLKPGAPLLLTTSATAAQRNTYHEKTAGWCFSLSALKAYFPDCDVRFDTESCENSLIASKVFLSRLDPYYYEDKETFCYQRRVTALPYLPVAVKLTK